MNKKLILATVLSVFFSINFSYAGELLSREAINYYNEGVREQEKGNLYAADYAYHKAILLNLDVVNLKSLLNNYGVMYLQLEDLKNAENFFNQALGIDSNYRIAQLNLGLIYDKKDNRLKALEYWLKILNIDLNKLKPKNFIIFDKADYSVNDTIFADPLNLLTQKYILNNLGIFYGQKDDLKSAEENFKKALKLDSNYRTAQLNLGLVYERRQDKLNALEYWLKGFNIKIEELKPKNFILEQQLKIKDTK
ncbi:hypothetical protein D4R78_06540 [bacterium]|nr:MAG: hypothetical protein D4R78_06540 [bacterium]